MTLDDVEQVLAIDRLSFSLPWPENSYRFELTQNRTSLVRVAVISPNQETSSEPEASSIPDATSNPGASTSAVIGMAVVWLVADEAHIATLAIHPDYRGRGFSKQLLAAALREAIQRGARLATLEVRAGNHIAQALYRKFGFETVGLRAHYYQDNQEDALLMTVSGIGEEYLHRLEAI